MPKKQYQEGPSRYSLLGTASTIGLHMVSAPAVGGLMGYGVDKLLGSWPIGAAIGLVLGIASGFHMVWKDFHYLQRNENLLSDSPQGETLPGAAEPDKKEQDFSDNK